jgi:uncharacterized protein YdhG (YjbR/CyaY superfamily)
MSVIDDYLEKFDDKTRTELERIRSIVLNYIPDPQETISYAMPTIKTGGKSIIGFDAHKEHIGIYPYSGHILQKIELPKDYGYSSGALRVPYDNPITEKLLHQIISMKLKDL